MKNSTLNNLSVDIIDFDQVIKSAPLQLVELPNNCNKVSIMVKREDLLHPIISGNKWRKLKYNLIEAKKGGFNTLLTFGGAYSNHIHATSYAGKLFGFKTIGLIRGEEHLPLNPTLEYAKSQGMEIHYIDRTTYRRKREKSLLNLMRNKFGDFYLLPEGGSNRLAVKGCAEIIQDIDVEFDYILAACGTGGTLAGLIAGLDGKKEIIGIPVLKGANFLVSEIRSLVEEYSPKQYDNWRLQLDYHFGGYAKINSELIGFMNKFELDNEILLDPVYTAKLMFAVNSMIGKGEFKEGSTVIAIHTGGIQGRKGMKNKVDKLLS
ncbi:MAG: pyridoxal-phosphate dependent enzyme [Melioribacteraceae bacterium]|nr:pyridoxal-phosphate dependent enzyme [Melioribacteraceae bacterium]